MTDRPHASIPIAALPPGVAVLVAKLLVTSPFRARDLARVVLVATPESSRVVLRAELAEELRRSDLPALAHECVARRVEPGEVLVYSAIENAEDAVVGFAVVRIAPVRRGRR